jgi:hypothetical protein
MKLRIAVLAALAAMSVGAISACVVEPARGYDVAVAPPEPRVVVQPEVRLGYVWAPGYWRWSGHEHVWVDGRYLHERRGYRYHPAHWEERHGRYHFEEGHWER